MKNTIIFLFSFLAITSTSLATERIGRLGVGMTTQLVNDLPAISFKIQQSKSFSFGGLLSLDSSDTGGWGAGIKLYRVIFEEPQANFYFGFLGALLNDKKDESTDKTGFQFDLTVGSEFSFAGLTSLGLSFETGISLNKIDDFAIQTVGSQFIIGSIHFYL